MEPVSFQSNVSLDTIIGDLEKIAQGDHAPLESLRNNLNFLLNQASAKDTVYGKGSRNMTLAEVVETALIALAEIKPLNDSDPVTLDEIEADDRVIFSDSQQYSLSTLLDYHKARDVNTTSGALSAVLEGRLRVPEAFDTWLLGHELRGTTAQNELMPTDIDAFKCALRRQNIRLPRIKSQSLPEYIVGGLFTWAFSHLFNDTQQHIDRAILCIDGLNMADFKKFWQRQDAMNDFQGEHLSALIFLISVKKLSIREAFAEITKLNGAQVNALKELYDRGVRGADLRSWDSDKITFGQLHANMLVFLMNEHNFSIDTALLEIDQLNDLEVLSLLDNYPTLRGRHFGERSQLRGGWLQEHEAFILHAHRNHGLSIEEAMRETTELFGDDVIQLKRFFTHGLRGADLIAVPGLTDDLALIPDAARVPTLMQKLNKSFVETMAEIQGLNPFSQNVLLDLYGKGLRGDHLRKMVLKLDTTFDATHVTILNFLMSIQSPEIACNHLPQICTKERHEVLEKLLSKKGLSVQQALAETGGLSNAELKALHDFCEYGLQGEHIRGNKDLLQKLQSIPEDGGKLCILNFMSKYTCDFLTTVDEMHEVPPIAKEALLQLYAQGLRREHLVAHFFEQGSIKMSSLQLEILTHLIIHAFPKLGTVDENDIAKKACELMQGKTQEELLTLGTMYHWVRYAMVDTVKEWMPGGLVIAGLITAFPSMAGAIALITVCGMQIKPSENQQRENLPVQQRRPGFFSLGTYPQQREPETMVQQQLNRL